MSIRPGRLMVVLVVAAILVPGGAWAQDLRSPDARSAAEDVVTVQDLRSPDARSAAEDITAVPLVTDLRSPDARDAADGTEAVQTPVVVTVPAADDFDWGDAAIGAGITLGVIMLVGAGMLFMRRRHVTPPGTTGRVEPTVQHQGRVRPPSRTRRRAGTR